MKLANSKLTLAQWLALLPSLAKLVGDVVDALKDGRLDDGEAKRLGHELVDLVAAIVHG